RGERAKALARRQPLGPGAAHVVVPDVERVLHVLRHAVRRPAEGVVGEVDLAVLLARAREARPDLLLQPGLRDRFGAHFDPISVRTSRSSGNSACSSVLRRNATPAVPPVPRLKPITRSTVLTWRKRQSWKFSSRSTSFSHMSYSAHQLCGSS